MNDDPSHANERPDSPLTGQVQYTAVSARVPDRIAAGVFSTGAIVVDGQDEMVIDFVQGLARPPRVVARVVLSPRVMAQFVEALRENLGKYEQTFGPPQAQPRRQEQPQSQGQPQADQMIDQQSAQQSPAGQQQAPAAQRRPSLNEIYEDLRIPDDMLNGTYATTVMIGHAAGEFYFDFITRFFPTAAVSARVFMSASQVQGVHDALVSSLEGWRRRRQR